MHARIPVACALLVGAFLPLMVHAQPGTGTRWEISMEMPGMPAGMGFALPKQQACMPKDNEEPPPADEGCTLLEQRSNGNRHFVKMQCPDGLMELEQTRTDSSMEMQMKMTEPGGEVNEMTMRGKALGDCDYTAEVDAQRRQVAAMEKLAADAERQGKEQVAQVCEDALDKMIGQMFANDGLCKDQRGKFCAKLDTLEGYTKLASTLDPTYADKSGAGLDEQVAACGTGGKALRTKHCATALNTSNYDFLRRFCPAEAPRLCTQAVRDEKLAFISTVCPAEKQSLVLQHCAGRQYSNQIAPKYRDFCAGSLGSDSGSDGAAPSGQPAQPAQGPQNQVKEGVKNLKKVFGF